MRWFIRWEGDVPVRLLCRTLACPAGFTPGAGVPEHQVKRCGVTIDMGPRTPRAAKRTEMPRPFRFKAATITSASGVSPV